MLDKVIQGKEMLSHTYQKEPTAYDFRRVNNQPDLRRLRKIQEQGHDSATVKPGVPGLGLRSGTGLLRSLG